MGNLKTALIDHVEYRTRPVGSSSMGCWCFNKYRPTHVIELDQVRTLVEDAVQATASNRSFAMLTFAASSQY